MKGSTRADRAYRAIRADILNGRLEPGSRLRVEALSERYEASSGVLREALPRLAGEGLAVLVPQQGYSVVAISADELRHLTQARVAIECQVFRQSMEAGDLAWESQVASSHHILSRTPIVTTADDLNDEWKEAHTAFHRALLAGCPNAWLRQLAESMRDHTEVYRSWSRRSGEERDRDIHAEHERLRDLALGRDLEEGVAALAAHIELTTDVLLEAGPAAG